MFSLLPKLCISGKCVCGGGRGASQHGLVSFSNPLCSRSLEPEEARKPRAQLQFGFHMWTPHRAAAGCRGEPLFCPFSWGTQAQVQKGCLVSIVERDHSG